MWSEIPSETSTWLFTVLASVSKHRTLGAAPSHASAQVLATWGEARLTEPRPIYKSLVDFTPTESEDRGSDHSAPRDLGSTQALPRPWAKILHCRPGSSRPSPAAPTQAASRRNWWQQAQRPGQPGAVGVGDAGQHSELQVTAGCHLSLH